MSFVNFGQVNSAQLVDGGARPMRRETTAAARSWLRQPAVASPVIDNSVRRSWGLAAVVLVIVFASAVPALVLLQFAFTTTASTAGFPGFRTIPGFVRSHKPELVHVHDTEQARRNTASIVRAGGLDIRQKAPRADDGGDNDGRDAVLISHRTSAAYSVSTPAAALLVVPPELALPPIPRPATPEVQSPAASESPIPSLPAALLPLLVIGVPSVRRQGDPNYLARALGYLMEQLVPASKETVAVPTVEGTSMEPFPMRVRIVVMDNTRDVKQRGSPGAAAPREGLPFASGHSVFEAAASHYCPAPACEERTVLGHRVRALPGLDRDGTPAATITFVRSGAGWAEPEAVDEGTPNVPGWRVRQQTRDVVALLRVANELFGSGPPLSERVYMFMEDDFRLCPSGMQALAYLLTLAGAIHSPPQRLPWNALRVSFGLNGALIHLGADAAALADYLAANAARRPPDHLTVEWFAGETRDSAATKAGRPHVAFRYNVLEHFGRASSLRGTETGLYSYCYDELNSDVVFEVEAFKALQCPHIDIWPCPPPLEGVPPPPAPAINFAALAARARSDTVQTWAPK